jgi:hypothetical protein
VALVFAAGRKRILGDQLLVGGLHDRSGGRGVFLGVENVVHFADWLPEVPYSRSRSLPSNRGRRLRVGKPTTTFSWLPSAVPNTPAASPDCAPHSPNSGASMDGGGPNSCGPATASGWLLAAGCRGRDRPAGTGLQAWMDVTPSRHSGIGLASRRSLGTRRPYLFVIQHGDPLSLEGPGASRL